LGPKGSRSISGARIVRYADNSNIVFSYLADIFYVRCFEEGVDASVVGNSPRENIIERSPILLP